MNCMNMQIKEPMHWMHMTKSQEKYMGIIRHDYAYRKNIVL